MSRNRDLETRTLLDELRSFDKGCLFDLGHPFLNRVAESFVKAAGIGAIQAVSREAYFAAVEGVIDHFIAFVTRTRVVDSGGLPPEISGSKKHRFPGLKGETNSKSLEALVKNTGKESVQWGLAAGMYSGLTYGLKEARGTHDWKNSAVAGAITGMALALTSDGSSHEQIVQSAITGAAISTTANLLAGIF
ncbi:mitochondrial import inner membrane translocase subunit Tim17/Tim22/Tim23 family protein [Actinidia rufa]|uniref:Mitochondrial import inner membrane translocase subunit Tim17/Tim22/Tim23 family protein n=1 Tax=Actinidia rufa TaxID=165716 RepID=A0A7J0GE44_9ERIC|nr:mitochondrial import inner membrane translocase subunit Tim17/Tim22/Tim23 family protein [Actinidia rufa]